MKQSITLTVLIVLLSSTALTHAQQQNTNSNSYAYEDNSWAVQDAQPLSLEGEGDETGSTTSTTTTVETSTTTSSSSCCKSHCHKSCDSHHCDGFWIFPEPADVGSIVTDRPGFSDSASLIPRGRFQIEAGYTLTYDREDHTRTIDHTFPEIAFRTGLTDWLEFRAKWNGFSLTETLDRIKTPAGRHVGKEDHDDGATDMNLGFKLPICTQEGWRPNISIIPSLNVPIGDDSKSANNVVPEIKLPWNYAVDDHWTIYGSILGRVQDGSSGQFFQTAATLATGYKVADWVTLYAEYYGVFPSLRDQDCSHLLSAGPIFKINDNLSIDMRASVGLNEQAPDFQASVGFGIRF